MTNCLNCDESLAKESAFCASCGAKVVTQRITLKRITTEVAETIFGWDNKYFVTLRALVIKPHVVLNEYVSGVRKRYVHPFTFLIIGATLVLFTFTLFLDNFMEDLQAFNMQMLEHNKGVGVKNLDLERVDHVQSEILKYFNIVTLLLIPLYSLFTYVIYRKTYHYAEHLIFNAYIQGTGFIIALVFFYLSLVSHPLVYTLATVALWFHHAYVFGKLYRLTIGKAILNLLLFLIMFAFFTAIMLALVVMAALLFANFR